MFVRYYTSRRICAFGQCDKLLVLLLAEIDSLLQSAISHAVSFGAEYADVRFERAFVQAVGAEDGTPKEVSQHIDAGFCVRALVGGAWGFCAVCGDEGSAPFVLKDAAAKAVHSARGASKFGRKLKLKPRPVCGKYATQVRRDPFEVSLEDRMAACVEASKRMSAKKGVTLSTVGMACERVEKLFHSSEGSMIRQDLTFTLANLFALAKEDSVSDYYLTTEGGQSGYESVTSDYDLFDGADAVADKAVEVVKAKSIKPRDTTVVVDPDAMALVVHEIAGHPCEADRVLGWEAAWAGTSWWADMVGQKIGSENVTIASDATLPGFLGSYGFDDEGTPASRAVHMDKGVLTGFLHSRETAAICGAQPNGAMRSTGFQFCPIIRMTNTYVEGGDWSKGEIIEDTKDGVYICGHHTPSIDSRRYNFQVRCKIAYEIKNGEIGKPLRGVSITGTSDKFWSSVDAAAGDVIMRPVPNCGKGDPMQTCMVGNGGPHLRAKARVVGLSQTS